MEKITSRNNEKIKNAAKLSTSIKERSENSLFIAEGARLCFDALLSGEEILEFYFTENAQNKFNFQVSGLLEKAKESFLITEEISQKLSDTSTPQGIFCVISQRQNSLEFNPKSCYIALDSVQDPANLGTVARTAEALGISGLILYNCCDIYNPKALRASMGAFFRLPVLKTDELCELLSFCNEKGIVTIAAVPDESAENITSLSFENGCVAVIGNEGNGVSNNVISACQKTVTIEMKGRAESLNAAASAAIIMWEMMK